MTDTATTAQAYTAIRARLEAGFTAIPRYYQNEDNVLPDDPVPFTYVVFDTASQDLAAYGGGAGANRWRNAGALEAYVFVPTGEGLTRALDYAEQIAALFRGQIFSGVICLDAQVDPDAVDRGPGADLPGNYHVVAAIITFRFDQIG